MDGGGFKAGLGEIGGEEVGVSLLTHEDEFPLARHGAQHFHQLLTLVELLHLQDGLVHVRVGTAHDAHRQENVLLRTERAEEKEG